MPPQHLHMQLERARQNGDLEGQIAILQELRAVYQEGGEDVAEIEVLRMLGNAYHDRTELQQAHACRAEAAQLADQLGPACPPRTRMHIEGDLGRSYIAIGEWSQATEYTHRALFAAQVLHDEEAQCLYHINLVGIYAQTGRRPEALKLAQEVLPVAKRLQDPYVLGLLYVNLANIFLREGRLTESQRHLQQAIAHAAFAQSPQLRLYTQYMLGELLHYVRLFTGNFFYGPEAESYLQQATEQAQALGDTQLEAAAELDLAQLYEHRRLPVPALRHYHRSLDLLEKVRAQLGYEEFQLAYFRSFQTTYENATGFLLRYGQLNQAFQTAERFRSRLLLAQLGTGRCHTLAWAPQQVEQLTSILNAYGQAVLDQDFSEDTHGQERGMTVGLRAIAAGGNEETSLDMPAVQMARQQFVRLYEGQRVYRTDWQPHQSPPVMDFQEVQQCLGHDEALVSYFVMEESVVIFVATAQAIHFQHLAYSRAHLAREVEALCTSINTSWALLRSDQTIAEEWFEREEPQAPWPSALREVMQRLVQRLEKLYALLIVPVLAVIAETPHWLIVPHGPLHRVPWAALRGAGHYVIEQHTVSLLPSASLYAALKSVPPPTAGEALFFADPDPDDEDLQLPGAQDEVQAGYATCQAGPPPFIGPTATKRAFLAQASRAGILHFACHHVPDASAGLLSFLKFAGEHGADFLYAFEITDMELAARLVVLSACESARSRIHTGDEQMGLVRAFLAAGARSVISTLWSIEDQSAARLFAHFYQHAHEHRLAEALAMAQRTLLAHPHYTLPFFWAPYVLSGIWNTSL